LAKFKNPADSLIKILSVNYPKTEADEQKIVHFVDKYQQIIQPKVLKERDAISFDEFKHKIDKFQPVQIRFIKQFVCLLYRNFLGLVRNPGSLFGRVIITLFVAANSLVIFWQIGDDLTKTRELTSSLFFTCIA